MRPPRPLLNLALLVLALGLPLRRVFPRRLLSALYLVTAVHDTNSAGCVVTGRG